MYAVDLAGASTNYGFPGFPFTQPVVSSANSLLPAVNWANPAWPPDDLYQRIAATGVTQDPSLGVITAVAFDCLGSSAGGVDVSINAADAAAWPALDGGVDGEPAAQTAGQGQFSGVASFFNVYPGSYTLTASVAGVGRVSQIVVTVGADASTGASLVPTP